ncbi:MAG: P-II family nitrogen regulator [Magnetococcales bacterium]|nr:P-II family nitrogen regulator [Magnetococcales bacterium]
MNFQLVVAIIKSDMTDKVIKAGKSAGAPGATVLPARGTGIKEAKTFFGMDLDIASDVVLFLVEERLVKIVQDTINLSGSFDNPGTGISFSLPIANVQGLREQIPLFEKHIADQKDDDS